MVQNLDRLKRKLLALPKAVKAETRIAMEQGGAEMVSLAKSLVPKDEGDLANTIEANYYEDRHRVVISAGGPETEHPVKNGLDASYNHVAAVELGTRKMAARPFFYPAWRALKKRARSRLSRAITKASKKVAAGG
jgi:HK97 gp10 family phage protein